MRKPEHQWETKDLRAVRESAAPGGPWQGDPRAEAFTLHFRDGRVARAIFGMQRQRIPASLAEDRDVLHAAQCWLAARGSRKVHCVDERGETLVEGSFGIKSLGEEIEDAQRLVSLAPSNAETIDALGGFDRVIACESSSDHPPEVAQLERLGPDLGPDLDRVAALRPDLVVSSLAVPGMERVVTGLRARGVPQLVLAPRSFADVVTDLDRVGRALGLLSAVAEVLEDLERQREALRSAAGERQARVYLEWWPKPMYTPGADCYSNELIALAGGRNVFADRTGSSVEIRAEELVAAQPDVCFVSWCGVEEAKLDPRNLIERPGLEELEAARAGRVYALDERFSGRPGPRMLEAARRMAARIAALG